MRHLLSNQVRSRTDGDVKINCTEPIKHFDALNRSALKEELEVQKVAKSYQDSWFSPTVSRKILKRSKIWGRMDISLQMIVRQRFSTLTTFFIHLYTKVKN